MPPLGDGAYPGGQGGIGWGVLGLEPILPRKMANWAAKAHTRASCGVGEGVILLNETFSAAFSGGGRNTRV